MTSTCNKCGIEIVWRKEGDKNVPYTTAGARHSYKDCPKAQDKPRQQDDRPKTINKQTRWEGIKEVREIKLAVVNEHLLNGWVILDRVERVKFEQVGSELREASESLYVVGLRA